MLADGLSLVTALILAGMLFFDIFSLGLLIVSQIIGVFFDGPGQVAKNTTVPAAAAEEGVPMVRAMGLVQTIQSLAMFLGPVSAGLLIAAFNEAGTLLITGVLFLVSIALVAKLKHKKPVHEHPMSTKQAYADMREAVQFIVREPFLGKMQLFGPLYGFILMPISIIVFPAWFIFTGQSSQALGLFMGAGALGGIFGGAAYAALGPKISQHKWMVGATATYALSLLGLFFLQPGSIAAIGVGFLAGFVLTGIFAICCTSFYTRTPQNLLGRVNSLGAAAGSLMAALAGLLFGWLVNATSAKAAILAAAIGMGALAVAAYAMPFMKLLDEKEEPEAKATAPAAEPVPAPVPQTVTASQTA